MSRCALIRATRIAAPGNSAARYQRRQPACASKAEPPQIYTYFRSKSAGVSGSKDLMGLEEHIELGARRETQQSAQLGPGQATALVFLQRQRFDARRDKSPPVAASRWATSSGISTSSSCRKCNESEAADQVWSQQRSDAARSDKSSRMSRCALIRATRPRRLSTGRRGARSPDSRRAAAGRRQG